MIIWLLFVLSVVACGRREGSVLSEGSSYKNGTGPARRFTLPDGSKVVLMPDTKIEVGRGFDSGNRKIEIDGEAMFNVVTGPIDIATRDLKLVVLRGARFRVDAYRARPGEEVDLLEGRMMVRKSYPSASDSLPETLDAGEMVMINRDIDLMEKEKMSPEEIDKAKGKF